MKTQRTLAPLAVSALSAVVLLSVARPAHADEAPSCAVDKHVGVSDGEAEAVEDVVCAAVRAGHLAPARHRVHIVRLGAKYILTLVNDGPSGFSEKQLVLTSLDEVTVAAPRLVDAAAEKVAVEQTVDVTNVVGGETRVYKKKTSEVHAWMGVIGASSPALGTGGGINLGISVGNEQWSFVADGRLAGEAFNLPASMAMQIFTLGSLKLDPSSSLSFLSLAGGARYHLMKTDFSPFVGAGIALDYIGRGGASKQSGAVTSYGSSVKDVNGNAGAAGYGELGLDFLRTHAVGGALVGRVDAPAYELRMVQSTGYYKDRVTTVTRAYAPVISVGVALRF